MVSRAVLVILLCMYIVLVLFLHYGVSGGTGRLWALLLEMVHFPHLNGAFSLCSNMDHANWSLLS